MKKREFPKTHAAYSKRKLELGLLSTSCHRLKLGNRERCCNCGWEGKK